MFLEEQEGVWEERGHEERERGEEDKDSRKRRWVGGEGCPVPLSNG